MTITSYDSLQQKLDYPQMSGIQETGTGRITFNQRSYAGTYNPKVGATPSALTVYSASSAGALNKEANLHQTAQNYIAGVHFKLFVASFSNDSGSVGTANCHIVDQLVSEANKATNVTGTFTFTTQSLPRYTSGEGVDLYVYTTSSPATSPTLYFTYTNQDGVSGRTSKTISTSYATTVIPGCQPLNSIGLQDGDTGVRSVESMTVTAASSSAGSVGYMLCKTITPWFHVATQFGESQPRPEHPVMTNFPICPFDKDACLTGILSRTDSGAGSIQLFLQIINDG